MYSNYGSSSNTNIIFYAHSLTRMDMAKMTTFNGGIVQRIEQEPSKL